MAADELMWAAKEKPRPTSAAARALKSLEPSSQIGGKRTSVGVTLMAPKRWPGGKPLVVEREQFCQQRRVLVGADGLFGSAKGVGSQRVGAGRATEPEIDAIGVKRFKETEGFGDPQRGVVGQHDAAGADADRAGLVRDVGDHDLRRAAREAGAVVVLSVPDTGVTEAFGKLGKLDGIAQGVGGCRAGFDLDEVEEREGQGHWASGVRDA